MISLFCGLLLSASSWASPALPSPTHGLGVQKICALLLRVSAGSLRQFPSLAKMMRHFPQTIHALEGYTGPTSPSPIDLHPASRVHALARLGFSDETPAAQLPEIVTQTFTNPLSTLAMLTSAASLALNTDGIPAEKIPVLARQLLHHAGCVSFECLTSAIQLLMIPDVKDQEIDEILTEVMRSPLLGTRASIHHYLGGLTNVPNALIYLALYHPKMASPIIKILSEIPSHPQFTAWDLGYLSGSLLTLTQGLFYFRGGEIRKLGLERVLAAISEREQIGRQNGERIPDDLQTQIDLIRTLLR